MVSEDMSIFMNSVINALNTQLELINRHEAALKKQEKEIKRLKSIINKQYNF